MRDPGTVAPAPIGCSTSMSGRQQNAPGKVPRAPGEFRWFQQILFFGLTLVLACGSLRAQEELTLHSIDEIHELPAEKLHYSAAVELPCVVAIHSQEWPITFIHDGRTGMYVVGVKDPELKPGDQILLKGTVTPGRYIQAESTTRMNNGIHLPEPRVVSYDRLQGRFDDSQYVSITGQIIGVDVDYHHFSIEMVSPEGGRFRGLLSEKLANINELRKLLGNSVRLHGIVGARVDAAGKFNSFQIWLPDLASIIPAENQTSGLPLSLVADLNQIDRVSPGAGYFRIQGKVDYRLSNQLLLIHDATGSMFVECGKFSVPDIDTTQEFRGVLDTTSRPPILRFAESQLTDIVIPDREAAQTLELSKLVEMSLSGEEVTTTGEYLGTFHTDGRPGFLLQDNGVLLPVFLSDQAPQDIASGTRIHVKGAWIQHQSLGGFNIGACALFTRSSNIIVGSQVPWTIITIVLAIGLVAAVSTLWAILLKRQVRIQTNRALEEYASRQKAEVQKQALEQQLLQAQKMESLGVLAGGIAHDFNNLLTIILGNASLIQESGVVAAAERTGLSNILAAATRASDLTRQMLAYAGQGALEFQTLQVNEVIQDFAPLLKASIAKSTSFDLDLNANCPMVLADATQLRQVILNLVLNSSESLNGQMGFVNVQSSSCRLSKNDLERCHVDFSDGPGDFLKLTVTDNGSGIDQHTLERMFDPFFTTKFSGRGLGLSTVLGIVRGHKGCIRITGKTGESSGTTFDVFFPASADAVALPPAHQSNQAAPPPVTTRRRVLIVDDEPSVAALLTRSLKLSGYDCAEAYSGGSALQLLSESTTKFDCVITDLTMPDMKGTELALRIHQRYPSLPIVLCSGYSESGADIGETSAIAAFLQKPFNLKRLSQVLSSVLEPSRATALSLFKDPAAAPESDDPGTGRAAG